MNVIEVLAGAPVIELALSTADVTKMVLFTAPSVIKPMPGVKLEEVSLSRPPQPT